LKGGVGGETHPPLGGQGVDDGEPEPVSEAGSGERRAARVKRAQGEA